MRGKVMEAVGATLKEIFAQCEHKKFNGGCQVRCEGCGHTAQYILGYKTAVEDQKQHASHRQERLDEAEKVVDECKGFTNLTAGKLASRYRERYPKDV